MDDPEADQSTLYRFLLAKFTDIRISAAVIGKLNLVDLAGSENNKVCTDGLVRECVLISIVNIVHRK